jgi:hypothetical protein
MTFVPAFTIFVRLAVSFRPNNRPSTHLVASPSCLSLMHPKASRNWSTPLVLRHPHIRIYRGRETRETQTPHRHGLRARLPRQHTARDTASGDSIPQIILRSQALDRAFGSREDGAHERKIAAGAERRAVHVPETDL